MIETFHIVRDIDGNYYIIPTKNDTLWTQFLENTSMSYSDIPEWAIHIDSYSSVYFTNFTL